MGQGAPQRWRGGSAAAVSSMGVRWGWAAGRGVGPVGRKRAWVVAARTRRQLAEPCRTCPPKQVSVRNEKKKEGGQWIRWVLAYCLARTLPACKLWVLVMRWTCRGVPWCVGATGGPVETHGGPVQPHHIQPSRTGMPSSSTVSQRTKNRHGKQPPSATLFPNSAK